MERLTPSLPDDDSLSLIPIMNVMMILVPFLLVMGSETDVGSLKTKSDTGRTMVQNGRAVGTSRPTEQRASLGVELSSTQAVFLFEDRGRPTTRVFRLSSIGTLPAEAVQFLRALSGRNQEYDVLVSPHATLSFGLIARSIDELNQWFTAVSLGRSFE